MSRLIVSLLLPVTLLACAEDLPTDAGASGEITTDAASPSADLAAITDDGTAFVFASPDQGGDVLAQDDLYTAQIQPREAGIRGRDGAITDFDGLRQLYRDDVQPWTGEERAALTAAIEATLGKINQIDRLLPAEVLLVKTGHVVEGGLPHTRGHAIIFAGGTIPSGDNLEALFLHELHHVLSRANEQLQDDYFALIGFRPCAFEEPEGLRAPRLSNPDAPVYRHYVPVDLAGADGLPGVDGVIPFLHASRPYDGQGGLGDYFGFGLVPVRVEGDVCTSAAQVPAELMAPGDVPAFLEALGGNTGYIIHPEETLADNFVLWAMDAEGVPSPQLPVDVGNFWRAAAP